MNDKLDQLLCQRYPAIFANRHKSTSESCMAWGFSCGDGWFNIINTLCSLLQAETDKRGAHQVVAQQVKEKFGELRFYCDGPPSERQAAYITMATALSSVTCEECGKPGLLQEQQRWLRTRCEDHAKEGGGLNS
jgi:hypothetical protein